MPHSLQTLENILEHISEGMVVHAPDYSIVRHNQRALEILGLTTEQLSGKTAYDFKRQTIHKYGRIRISGE